MVRGGFLGHWSSEAGLAFSSVTQPRSTTGLWELPPGLGRRLPWVWWEAGMGQ